MLHRTIAALAVLLVTACGGAAEPPQPTASTDAARAAPPRRTPEKHVPAASLACSSARGPGNVNVEATVTGCRSDAECTAGTNGRCSMTGLGVAGCTYDACTTDADCGSGAFCDCRAGEGDSAANRCVQGSDCRSDDACGGPYCSPSLVPDGCGGTSLAFEGYFCHSSRDACIDDRDCAGETAGGATCDYDKAEGRWRCSVRSCVSD